MIDGESDQRATPLRYQRHSDVVAEPSGERIVLIHADCSEISTLNPVGALVWAHFPPPAGHLRRSCRTFGDQQVTTIGDDLDRFLNEMLDRETSCVVVEPAVAVAGFTTPDPRSGLPAVPPFLGPPIGHQ